MTLRALIVDDEPLARSRVRRLLRAHADVEVLDECGDGASAVRAIEELEVDVVFLDVQMPEMDGFEVLRAVPREKLPVVIFITAHDEHAVKAFEVHALDYLLKPFGAERFARALERAREQLEGRRRGRRELDPSLVRLIASLKERAGRTERFAVRSRSCVVLVKADDIDWIEAAGKHVRLHVGRAEHLLRATMDRMMERLDPERFARIHRSAIVQIDRIVELEPAFHGDFVVRLRGGAELAMSRSYRKELERRLGGAL